MRDERRLQTMRKEPPNGLNSASKRCVCSLQTKSIKMEQTKRKKQTNESNDKTTTRSVCGRERKDAEQLAAPLSAETPRDGHARRQANTPTQHRGMDYTAFLYRHRAAYRLKTGSKRAFEAFKQKASKKPRCSRTRASKAIFVIMKNNHLT